MAWADSDRAVGHQPPVSAAPGRVPFGQTPERPEHTGGTQAVFLARQLSLIKPQSQTQNLHDTPRNHTGAAGQL